MTYFCKDCNKPLTVETAYKNSRNKSGLNIRCVECEKARVTKWRASSDKHKDTRRNYHLMKTFGISLDDYNELLKEQNHSCAICGIDEVDATHGTLCVDHCHETGEVRGLLCHNCNVGIGNLQDSVALLDAAIDYLKRY